MTINCPFSLFGYKIASTIKLHWQRNWESDMGRPHVIHLYTDPAVWVQPKVVFSRSWGLGFRLNATLK